MIKLEIIDEIYGNYEFLLDEKDIHEIHPHDSNPNAVVFTMKNYGNYSHGKYNVSGSLQFWEDMLEVKSCIPEKKKEFRSQEVISWLSGRANR